MEMEVLKDVSANEKNKFGDGVKRNIEGIMSLVLFATYQPSFWKLSCFADFIIAHFPSSATYLFSLEHHPPCF